MAPSPYADRRARLVARLPARTLVIAPAAGLAPRNGDAHHPFRQDSTFQYLTGFPEPNAVLLLRTGERGEAPQVTLLVQPRDPAMETWTGRRAGPEGAIARYGADAAFPIDDLDTVLDDLLGEVDNLAYELGRDEAMDKRVIAAARRHWNHPRRQSSGPDTWLDLAAHVSELRLFKDDHDLAILRRSTHAASEGHALGMRTVRPGMTEGQLQGVIEFGFRAHGGQACAYNSIVAGGNNANILHYDTNRDVLRAGDLVLVDAGCEVDCMASDITRTFPVSGRFTEAQAALYDAVLDAQLAAIAAARPGADLETIHGTAVASLARSLHALGFFAESPETIVEDELYKRYYMHRTGHWLGLDVHDVGRYRLGESARKLEPGMVFTIEPGLYVEADDDQAPARFRGIGIRIEDDVLVTEGGCEVLTASCPKTRAEIEAVMAEAAPIELPTLSAA